MISAKLKKRLAILKDSKKIPSVILVTGLYETYGSEKSEGRKDKLIQIAKILEASDISEAKGSLLFLDSEGEAVVKVDEVRFLLKSISLQNWDGNAKRYVLVPRAELLTVQSSNALLKSLEESPKGTHFILGAPSKRSVLRTVLSRSFVLNEESEELNHGLDGERALNTFSEAFFHQKFDQLLKLARIDLKYEWQRFSLNVKEEFISEVYSGDLDKKEWSRLFSFMDEVDQKIEANIDVKWLASSIERFDFKG